MKCRNCGRGYPAQGHPFRCPSCGGIYDFEREIEYKPGERRVGEGIGRYRSGFPLSTGQVWQSLGEGDTALVPLQFENHSFYLKCEFQNPTGSFKDRGAAVLVSALAAAGVTEAIEDSSGNAGAAFAAYAARAGISARVFVPDYASGPKRRQIESYGSEVVRILGPRSTTTEKTLAEAEQGAVYASHAYLPHVMVGFATIAFELFEELGQEPYAVVVPVGQGTLLLGLHHGFMALKRAGLIGNLPRLIGVQARACAPLWSVFHGGAAGLTWVSEGSTQAEGIRILQPLRGDAVLQAVEESGGTMLVVEEDEISEGRDALGRQGLYVEPTSAVVWSGVRQIIADHSGPVVAILTGSGLKSS
ncbi:MAG: pyridoxal-phosphate dependent enzyme [Anaerolineales bacterium]|jgi:threonine synthase